MKIYKLLHLFPPELAHFIAMQAMRVMPSNAFKSLRKPYTFLGLNLHNRVGLAAGFDKNGEYVDDLAKLGFGFIEVGTVTPKPQPGNAKPRIFRLTQDAAIINRMGFNNRRVDAMVQALKKRRSSVILGINIGKNKETPLKKAKEDYLYCMKALYEHCDYMVVNVSSPNTENLRQLQSKVFFDELMRDLKVEQEILSKRFRCYKPLLVKISPDESYETVQQMTQSIEDYKIDGIVVTNTTVQRPKSLIATSELAGGLSGKPLRLLSNDMLKMVRACTDTPIIGVGGICSKEDAVEKCNLGASIVQIYTGLIYQGPKLVYDIANALAVVE